MKDVYPADEYPRIDEFRNQGLAVFRYDDGPFHSSPPDAPWLHDEEFNGLYSAIRDNTLVDRTRCYSHFELLRQAMKAEGDVLEVGVWRGGTGGLLAKLATGREVFLADTFNGVVKAEPWEMYENGEYADTSPELVRSFMEDLGVGNVRILAGIFPEETGTKVADKIFAYVHIDVDVYRSAKDVFSFVWPKVAGGGIVVFDDHGFISHCGGVYKFVREIKDDEDKLFVHNINGQAYIIKK